MRDAVTKTSMQAELPDLDWAAQLRLPLPLPRLQEKTGAIYTKPWVVELILDLAGYRADTNLVDTLAVEPAAGDGAFVVPMVRRLLTSCRRQERSLQECSQSLLIYELDEESAAATRAAVLPLMLAEGIGQHEAQETVAQWIRTADYLLEAPSLPHAQFVIGNPPYIRLEDLDEQVAALYRNAYRTMTGRADIYIAFFEAALRQLVPGGVCAFICADRWMFNQYGAELRRLITSSFSVETVIAMHQANAFASEVSAYPAITVVRKAQQGAVVVANADEQVADTTGTSLDHTLEAVRTQGTRSQPLRGLSVTRVATWFQGANPWPCGSPEQIPTAHATGAGVPPVGIGRYRNKGRYWRCHGFG